MYVHIHCLAVTSEPRNVRTSEKTTTMLTLEWDPPLANKECVHHYTVCHMLIPGMHIAYTTAWDEVCQQTAEVTDPSASLSFNLTDLEPCAKYRISITAVTPKGKQSLTIFYEDSAELEGIGCLRYITLLQ